MSKLKKATIYTRAGDRGETTLLGGQKVSKNNLRIEAYGTIDELNSSLGAASAFITDKKISKVYPDRYYFQKPGNDLCRMALSA